MKVCAKSNCFRMQMLPRYKLEPLFLRIHPTNHMWGGEHQQRGDDESQQLPMEMTEATSAGPMSPLFAIDEFIYLSLACRLPSRPSVTMKMNSPPCKMEKSCPGNKKLSLQYHRGVFISS